MPRSQFLIPCALVALLHVGCVDDAGPSREGASPAPPDAPPEIPAPGERALGDLRLFARIPPETGNPEGVHLWGSHVFVGTVPYDLPQEPGTLHVLDRVTGQPVREIRVEAKNDTAGYRGLAGLTVDGRGRVYAAGLADGRVLRWDPSRDWTQETYVEIPDLKPCGSDPPPCSPTREDRPPLPNDLVFDEAGNLYVTDSFQATIWRTPPGGEARPWFQDARLDHVFGPNGIRVSPDGTRIFFDTTYPDPGDLALDGLLPAPLRDPARKAIGIYTLPLTDAPAAADLRLFYGFEPERSVPDGLTFGASGNLYVTLLRRHEVLVLDPEGNEVRRLPDPLVGVQHDPPIHSPASLVFDDARRALLLTNYATQRHALATDPGPRFAVLDLFVDDTSAPMARPTFH